MPNNELLEGAVVLEEFTKVCLRNTRMSQSHSFMYIIGTGSYSVSKTFSGPLNHTPNATTRTNVFSETGITINFNVLCNYFSYFCTDKKIGFNIFT